MNVLMSVLRTGAQALVGALVTWLAARGLSVPVETQTWIVEVLIVGGGITAYTAVVRWLETRTGTGLPARAGRGLARLLMLGLAAQPIYTSRLPAGMPPQLATNPRRHTGGV
jgi:hypothetical protein